MRALLISTVVGLTGLTFFGAERLTTSSTAIIAAEQATKTQAALDTQKARLTELQSDQKAEIKKLQTAGLVLEAQTNTLNKSVLSLTQERDGLSDDLIKTRIQSKLLSNDFEVRTARLADAEAEITTLNETIAANQAQLEGISVKMAALQQEADTASLRVTELENAPSVPEASNAEASEQTLLLQAGIEERDVKLADLLSQTSGLATEIDTLKVSMSERDTLITTLEAQLANVDTLTSDATDAQIENLTATLAERDATIAGFEAAKDDVAPDAEVVSVAAHEAEIEGMTAQVSELTALLASQTGIIESLRFGLGEDQKTAEELAQLCVARASDILETSQIIFRTGTAAIDEGSENTLERLRDLAIGCNNEGLIIEIGGHTDSQGAAENNQSLSELRAQAVVGFLTDLGIASDSMSAVGFGETQPIATNDTREGRAANRRITFAWRVASDTADDAASIVPETANETQSANLDE